MEHTGTFDKKILYPGEPLTHPEASCLPSLLKKNTDGTFDYVTEEPVSVGDTIEPCFLGKLQVKEIVEQRSAKGDWVNTSYAGKNVTWQRVRV